MTNKFATALKKKPVEDKPQVRSKQGAKQPDSIRPSRIATKHVGGYYDPAVSKQLRRIALDEDSSVQSLLAEAIDMLFQSRKKPTIAQK